MKHAKLQPLLVALLLLGGVALAGSRAPQSATEQQGQTAAPTQCSQTGSATSADLNAAKELPAAPNTRPIADETAGAEHTLQTGSTVDIRVADAVNSSKDHEGDLIVGIVDPSVFVGDHVVIPRGTEAHLRIMFAQRGHPLGGTAKVQLELTALVLNKQKVDIYTGDYGKTQKPLSAKLRGAGLAGASSTGPGVVTSTVPETAGISPVIAAFRSARVYIPAGSRIKFTVRSPFSFEEPANDGPGS